MTKGVRILTGLFVEKGMCRDKRKVGGEGHRSPYLSHAKRALYHLSYTPFPLSLSTCPLSTNRLHCHFVDSLHSNEETTITFVSDSSSSYKTGGSSDRFQRSTYCLRSWTDLDGRRRQDLLSVGKGEEQLTLGIVEPDVGNGEQEVVEN